VTENVGASIDAARAALENLRDGLTRGGFQDALPTYRRMVEVVIAQRVMVDDRRFDASFAVVAGLAADIGELLTPWARLMSQLAAMEGAAQGVREANAAEVVLAWLVEHRGHQPAARIRAGVTLPAEEVTAALDELVAAGAVVEHMAGRRRSWAAVTTSG
jgi:hypothetical protein